MTTDCIKNGHVQGQGNPFKIFVSSIFMERENYIKFGTQTGWCNRFMDSLLTCQLSETNSQFIYLSSQLAKVIIKYVYRLFYMFWLCFLIQMEAKQLGHAKDCYNSEKAKICYELNSECQSWVFIGIVNTVVTTEYTRAGSRAASWLRCWRVGIVGEFTCHHVTGVCVTWSIFIFMTPRFWECVKLEILNLLHGLFT